MALARLIVYTPEYLLLTEVDPGRQRLSDHLNDPAVTYLETVGPVRFDLGSSDDPGTTAPWAALRLAAVLFVLPRDAPLADASRAPTEQWPMELGVGAFLVRGLVHRRVARPILYPRPPEPSALMQFLAREERRFLPVTAATIRYLPNGRYDTRAPVALVSMAHLDYWALGTDPPPDVDEDAAESTKALPEGG